jgi:hypothetical protein
MPRKKTKDIIENVFKATNIIFLKIILNLKSKTTGPCFKPMLLTIPTRSLSLYSYQKDERAKPGNFPTRDAVFPSPQ